MRIKKLALTALLSMLPLVASAGDLSRYSEPQRVTRLDWILLKVQSTTLVRGIKWDDQRIVRDVYLDAITPSSGKKGPAVVSAFFLVDDRNYQAATIDATRKAFRGAVDGLVGLLKHDLPEISTENLVASFSLVDGGVVASFRNNKLSTRD